MKAKCVHQAAPAWRFSLAMLLLAVLACLLIWRVLSLQVLDAERGREFLQDQGDARAIRQEVIPAYRGVIADRNGEPLAVSTPVATLWANPRQLMQAPTQWAALASALDMDYKKLVARLRDNADRGFIYLRRQLAPAQAEKVLALKVPGVYAQREYKRFYPAAEVAAHLIGFTDIDERGQEGLELAYESWLQAEQGSKRVLKDLRGHIIRDIEQQQAPKPGRDLVLSIDLRLQYLAYRELKAALQKTRARSGSIVLLDSRSGEVLAMVNQPSYNPNNRSELSPQDLRNRAMTDVFEPGSTVKPLTVVAALESGRYQPHTAIDTNPGYIRVGSKTLLDPVNYGVIDVTKVLTKSSQVGTSKIALDLDEQQVWQVFQRFGLGSSTESGFPGESAGLVPHRSQWRAIERVNFAFGYGLSVTPLQLARAYAAFASGGILRPISLLRQDEPVAGQRIVSEQTARQIVAMLKTVTEDGGTATRAQTAAYSVAGKTGTVHKLGSQGYADDRYLAVFAGMAPASDPRLVAVVMINEPQTDKYYGGEVAAPVFSRVMADALRLLNIDPDKLEGLTVAAVDRGAA